MDYQQGDVKLYHTVDGGDFDFVGDFVEFTGGFETAAYIALFGGNEQDDNTQDTPNQWWGNALETDDDYKIRSYTAYLLRSIPSTPYNLNRIKNAVLSDLEFLKNIRAVSSIEVTVNMPAVNHVEIIVDIKAEGLEKRFNFVENWKATS